MRVAYAPQGEQEPRGIATIDWTTLADAIDWADVSAGTRQQLIEGDQAPDVLGVAVDSGWFGALGARVTAGRVFTPDEYRQGAEQVVIAGAVLMRGRAFSESPPQYLNLTRPNSGDPPTPYRIVGVLPPSFRHAREYARGDVEFVLPQLAPSPAYMVRLRAGIPLELAARRMNESIRRTDPGLPTAWPGVRLVAIQDDYVGVFAQSSSR